MANPISTVYRLLAHRLPNLLRSPNTPVVTTVDDYPPPEVRF